jgi:hypothetical protein
VTVVSKPAVLDGRPEDVAPVAARHEVAAREAQDPVEQRPGRIVAGVAQAQDLALDRADRHVGERGRPGAGGHDDGGRGERADVGHLGALAQLDARGRARALQRGQDGPRIDRVVVGDVQRQADGRGERGLEAAGGARQEALGPQAQAGAEGVLAIQGLGLVAVAGDEQRAARLQRDAELAREGRPQRGGLDGLGHVGRVADLGLADRREHPGRDAGRAGAEHVALEQHGAQARPGRRAARSTAR